MTHPKDDKGYYKLARQSELPDGEILQVPMEDQGVDVEVGLVRSEGKLYAFRDICPHQAFPLSVGHLRGRVLECVGHGWQFDLRTGRAVYPPVRKSMTFYDVREDGDDIWVRVDPLF